MIVTFGKYYKQYELTAQQIAQMPQIGQTWYHKDTNQAWEVIGHSGLLFHALGIENDKGPVVIAHCSQTGESGWWRLRHFLIEFEDYANVRQ